MIREYLIILALELLDSSSFIKLIQLIDKGGINLAILSINHFIHLSIYLTFSSGDFFPDTILAIDIKESLLGYPLNNEVFCSTFISKMSFRLLLILSLG